MTILQEIIEYKKEEVIKQKRICSIEEFQNKIKELPATVNFYEKLKDYKQQNKIAIIAEVKKASPSKGIIRKDFNHIEIAKIYEKAEVAAISVLTDEKFFQGKIEYLTDIRKFSKLPILRKDFIIDEFQIYQTRSMGADIILLIASALEEKQLEDYFHLSKELGLEVLLEVHDKKEYDAAFELGAKIIGINNRNLKTFDVSLQNTINLINSRKLDDEFIISESGIKDKSDIQYLLEHNVSGFLIGETLLRKKIIETTLQNLVK